MVNGGLLARQSGSGSVYLVWHSHRYLIKDPTTLVPAVFGAQAPVLTVGTAWLNGLPAGQELAPISVPHQGAASDAVPGAHAVGDIVYDRTGAGNQYYLILRDGLAPITRLQMLVQVTMTVEPVQLPTKVFSLATESKRSLYPSSAGGALPPASPPRLPAATPGVTPAVCAVWSRARANPLLVVGSTLSSVGRGIETPAVTGAGTSLADRVVVPPGCGTVVLALPSPTATTGALDLITDAGVRYPVPSVDALGKLGYTTAMAVPMPAGMVARIPEGPTLDPSAALRPATSFN
jgi:hypothetical protein